MVGTGKQGGTLRARVASVVWRWRCGGVATLQVKMSNQDLYHSSDGLGTRHVSQLNLATALNFAVKVA